LERLTNVLRRQSVALQYFLPRQILAADDSIRTMTAAEFRRLALSLPEAIEGAHMNHPDFRVGGKIFATLSPSEEYGVVMLSPAEQKEFVEMAPASFFPVKGGWGRSGSTRVDLEAVDAATLRKAMAAAWRKRAPKRLLKGQREKRKDVLFRKV
jgi:hypothetical protein